MDSLTRIHETDILQILRREKHKVRKELQRSEQKMSEETRTLFAPVPKAASRFQLVSGLASNGMAIYQGVRIGTGLIRAVSTLFRRKK